VAQQRASWPNVHECNSAKPLIDRVFSPGISILAGFSVRRSETNIRCRNALMPVMVGRCYERSRAKPPHPGPGAGGHVALLPALWIQLFSFLGFSFRSRFPLAASRATRAGFADEGMDRRRFWLFTFGGGLVSIASLDQCNGPRAWIDGSSEVSALGRWASLRPPSPLQLRGVEIGRLHRAGIDRLKPPARQIGFGYPVALNTN